MVTNKLFAKCFVKLVGAGLLALLTLSSLACTPASSWYPAGSASLADHYELTEAGSRQLVVITHLANTGASAINRSTFTIHAQTADYDYYKTVTSDLRIVPGAAVYVTASIVYNGELETGLVAPLVVEAFFE